MKIEAAVIKGDGVGPEMMAAAVQVLETVCQKFGHELKLYEVPACSETIESCYQPLPQQSLQLCQSVPAVLFGNSGLSKYRNLPIDKRPEAALLGLRKGMGVTTNIRPVRYYPSLASEYSARTKYGDMEPEGRKPLNWSIIMKKSWQIQHRLPVNWQAAELES